MGREKHNSIPMPANRAASREHCKVWREGPQRFSIADFGSTNGTLRQRREGGAPGPEGRRPHPHRRGSLPLRARRGGQAEAEDAEGRGGPTRPGRRPEGRGGTAARPQGNEPGGVASIEVKQRVLHYHKKSRRGSVLANDMGQMAGLSKWILVIVALGLAVGGFLAAQQCTVKTRQAQLPPAELPVVAD